MTSINDGLDKYKILIYFNINSKTIKTPKQNNTLCLTL